MHHSFGFLDMVQEGDQLIPLTPLGSKPEYIYIIYVLQGRVEIMYKVVTQRDALCVMPQRRPYSARSSPKCPRLNNNHTSAVRGSQSDFPSHFGYVSIDHLVPYSIVVRLESQFISQ